MVEEKTVHGVKLTFCPSFKAYITPEYCQTIEPIATAAARQLRRQNGDPVHLPFNEVDKAYACGDCPKSKCPSISKLLMEASKKALIHFETLNLEPIPEETKRKNKNEYDRRRYWENVDNTRQKRKARDRRYREKERQIRRALEGAI